MPSVCSDSPQRHNANCSNTSSNQVLKRLVWFLDAKWAKQFGINAQGYGLPSAADVI
jgi:hypothetical protein